MSLMAVYTQRTMKTSITRGPFLPFWQNKLCQEPPEKGAGPMEIEDSRGDQHQVTQVLPFPLLLPTCTAWLCFPSSLAIRVAV
jgi:hypothetical protein